MDTSLIKSHGHSMEHHHLLSGASHPLMCVIQRDVVNIPMSPDNCCRRNCTSLKSPQSPAKVSKLISCPLLLTLCGLPYLNIVLSSQVYSFPHCSAFIHSLLCGVFFPSPPTSISSSVSDLIPTFPWTFSHITSLHTVLPGPAVPARLHLWTLVRVCLYRQTVTSARMGLCLSCSRVSLLLTLCSASLKCVWIVFK